MNDKKRDPMLDEYIELLRKIDIDKLKYDLSRETGPLSDEIIEAEEEQKKIAPRVSVRVSDDRMNAWLTVNHPGQPRAISLNYFYEQLKTKGVVSGLIEENMENILDRNVFQQEVLAAQGSLPTDGKDGMIRLMINRQEDPDECLDVRGRVDFKKMRLKNVVRKGEVIAERVPPVPGKPGYRVDGEEIPPKPVRESAFRITPDVAVSKDNELQLVALKDGIFYPDFTIRDISVINSDVDYGTGNIRFAKSLVIKGDVKSGFTVQSGGDIEIFRCVEDSRVTARGNVIVKEGFLGAGKGMIKARNVTVGHVKQQKIVAEEDIVVGGEVMYARLKAGGNIRVMGIKGIVIGSMLVAGKGIEVGNAGNAQNIKTHLCAGYNNEIIRMDNRIMQFEEMLKKANHGLKIFHAAGPSEQLSEKSRELMRKLDLTRMTLRDEIAALQQRRIALLGEIAERDRPFIKVTGTVFPNTTIQIGDAKNYVSKEIRNKLFILHKDRILEMAATSLRRGDATEK